MRTFKDADTAADFIANLVLEREFDSRNDASASLAQDFADDVQVSLSGLGIVGTAAPQGSIAKGTNLGASDIDIFIVLPRDTPVDFSTVAMQVATDVANRRAFGPAESVKVTPMVASHPYAVLAIGNRGSVLEIDIVPCYDVSADQIVSAVDRTPHHTRFMNENLTSEQKNDVRKMKLFMKGIGVYGADVWTGGFSGYACEVLVHKYGSFLGVLKNTDDLLRLNDPVDANRNVLASVSEEQSRLFSTCAGSYVRHPRIDYFYPYLENPDMGEFNVAFKAVAADENVAAKMRATFEGRVCTFQKNRPEFNLGGRYFWNNGTFYALFSSGHFPAAVSRAGPPTSMTEAHAAWVAANSNVPDRVIDHSDNTVTILNRIRNVTELAGEIGHGFETVADLSELNSFQRSTIPPFPMF